MGLNDVEGLKLRVKMFVNGSEIDVKTMFWVLMKVWLMARFVQERSEVSEAKCNTVCIREELLKLSVVIPLELLMRLKYF
jgi:hypothetical protein